jgi:hypothetical protein
MDFGHLRGLKGGGESIALPRSRREAWYARQNGHGKKEGPFGTAFQVMVKEAEATAWVSGTAAEMV